MRRFSYIAIMFIYMSYRSYLTYNVQLYAGFFIYYFSHYVFTVKFCIRLSHSIQPPPGVQFQIIQLLIKATIIHKTLSFHERPTLMRPELNMHIYFHCLTYRVSFTACHYTKQHSIYFLVPYFRI